ncbi:MAG: redoxin domain-containing protein [Akkermansiaceae bacterium]|jgi:peroxiredoxin|nr:redoxin domain-containing protein [Akkermansiaceae bacterium]MDP4645524.1 redoxin domain-containing protein [Akkermansiaceae bacterium]MDP4719867.1 redoxin domain-containing protein [Akkermansiaceae bacterium]MDP4778669.1 redoxin domain-containing protein [Akkermansiaceae bacterium]MDP4848261.1 redoxin domain-containing protein [Akkermansiaceae bacterium]
MTKTLVAIIASAGIGFAAEVPKVLPIGSDLPSFSLPGIDGKTHTEADYADSKILCIIFTSNHCPDSVAVATRMEAIHQDYKDKGIALVAVSANNPASLRPDELSYSIYGDSFEEMKPFAESNGWTLPYLYDGETQAFATACGAQSTPHVFVFDSERKLRYTGRLDDARRASGPVDKSYLRDAFDALLAGEEIETPTTRSFGCSTKWLFKVADVEAAEKAWKETPITLEELDTELAKKLKANKSGNLRMINFWSTTCGPCVAEFPDLVATYRRFQNRNFDFISISLDPTEDKAKVEKFLQSRSAALGKRTAPSLKKEGRTSNNYLWTGSNPDELAEAIYPEWTGALPLTLLIAPDGEIIHVLNEEIEISELTEKILEALK